MRINLVPSNSQQHTAGCRPISALSEPRLKSMHMHAPALPHTAHRPLLAAALAPAFGRLFTHPPTHPPRSPPLPPPPRRPWVRSRSAPSRSPARPKRPASSPLTAQAPRPSSHGPGPQQQRRRAGRRLSVPPQPASSGQQRPVDDQQQTHSSRPRWLREQPACARTAPPFFCLPSPPARIFSVSRMCVRVCAAGSPRLVLIPHKAQI